MAHVGQLSAFSQFRGVILLGCTRGGSPGILGVRTPKALCIQACSAPECGALWAKLSGELWALSPAVSVPASVKACRPSVIRRRRPVLGHGRRLGHSQTQEDHAHGCIMSHRPYLHDDPTRPLRRARVLGVRHHYVHPGSPVTAALDARARSPSRRTDYPHLPSAFALVAAGGPLGGLRGFPVSRVVVLGEKASINC